MVLFGSPNTNPNIPNPRKELDWRVLVGDSGLGIYHREVSQSAISQGLRNTGITTKGIQVIPRNSMAIFVKLACLEISLSCKKQKLFHSASRHPHHHRADGQRCMTGLAANKYGGCN